MKTYFIMLISLNSIASNAEIATINFSGPSISGWFQYDPALSSTSILTPITKYNVVSQGGLGENNSVISGYSFTPGNSYSSTNLYDPGLYGYGLLTRTTFEVPINGQHSGQRFVNLDWFPSAPGKYDEVVDGYSSTGSYIFGKAIINTLNPNPVLTPFSIQQTTSTSDLYKYYPSQQLHKYTLSFDGGQFKLSMQVNVEVPKTETRFDSLISVWQEGINTTWGNKFQIVNGSTSYPLIFDVHLEKNLQTAFSTIKIKDTFTNIDSPIYRQLKSVPHCDFDATCTFYTNLFGNDERERGLIEDINYAQGDAAAHEFGHIMGLCDEYNSVECAKNHVDAGVVGIMEGWQRTFDGVRHIGQPLPQNYENILRQIRSVNGFSSVVGFLPALQSSQGTFIPTIDQPSPVPEPSQKALISLSAIVASIIYTLRRAKSHSNRYK